MIVDNFQSCLFVLYIPFAFAYFFFTFLILFQPSFLYLVLDITLHEYYKAARIRMCLCFPFPSVLCAFFVIQLLACMLLTPNMLLFFLFKLSVDF